jgi:hypothetical protein
MVPGCMAVLTRERDYKVHCEKTHSLRQPPRTQKISLKDKHVFACGFDDCRTLNNNWKDRCDHVAQCMKKGTGQWDYSRKIRNLLRHEAISPTWKLVRDFWCRSSGIHASALKWDPKLTKYLRQVIIPPNIGCGL